VPSSALWNTSRDSSTRNDKSPEEKQKRSEKNQTSHKKNPGKNPGKNPTRKQEEGRGKGKEKEGGKTERQETSDVNDEFEKEINVKRQDIITEEDVLKRLLEFPELKEADESTVISIIKLMQDFKLCYLLTPEEVEAHGRSWESKEEEREERDNKKEKCKKKKMNFFLVPSLRPSTKYLLLPPLSIQENDFDLNKMKSPIRVLSWKVSLKMGKITLDLFSQLQVSMRDIHDRR